MKAGITVSTLGIFFEQVKDEIVVDVDVDRVGPDEAATANSMLRLECYYF